eukprot:4591578-Pleurochrysis_carterae.AAC.3
MGPRGAGAASSRGKKRPRHPFVVGRDLNDGHRALLRHKLREHLKAGLDNLAFFLPVPHCRADQHT